MSAVSWLSLDTDDLCHLPSQHGHPTRSRSGGKSRETSGESEGGPAERGEIGGAGREKVGVKRAYRMSEQLQSAWTGFREWRLNAGQAIPVTLFVVAEQTTCPRFMSEMMDLLQIDTTILVGCHGLDHRCWSAWRPDPQGFQTAMESADGMLAAAFGPRYRRWFRAPGGYIAPWMAAPLATAGFVLDSSVNPSWLVRRKSGQRVDSRGFNGWGAVTQAIRSAGLIEREWAISSAASRLPLNGPALHLFPLSLLSRRYWCRISQTWATENELLDPQQDVCTYYWHILDHRRRNGRWVPPLPKRNNLEVRLGIATEQAI